MNQRKRKHAHLIDVRQRFIISNQHLCKLSSLLRVDTHDAPQQEDVVRSVANLLGIQDDLLELTGLRKTLDHLNTITPVNQSVNLPAGLL